jgi:hypothetical protein
MLMTQMPDFSSTPNDMLLLQYYFLNNMNLQDPSGFFLLLPKLGLPLFICMLISNSSYHFEDPIHLKLRCCSLENRLNYSTSSDLDSDLVQLPTAVSSSCGCRWQPLTATRNQSCRGTPTVEKICQQGKASTPPPPPPLF